MAEFTTLADELKEKISQYVKSGNWNVLSVTSEDGVTHSFSTPNEMIDFYNSIKALALAEEDDLTATTYRPILMRIGGGFR
jgi:hypothetical protein